MTTVYLATAGEYSDFRVVHAFARREDAESYKLGDEVTELEVHEGPVEVRYWYDLRWWPEDGDLAYGNARTDSEYRDFDGNEKHAKHGWHKNRQQEDLLIVEGWDLALVKKVYSEQRAQYLARKEGIS